MYMQVRSLKSVSRWIFLPLLLSPIGSWQAAAAVPPPQAASGAESVESQFQAGQALLEQAKPAAAAAAFNAANEAAGGKCGRCLLGLARALESLGRPDAAVTTTRAAVAALAGDPLLGRAFCQLGDLLLRFGTRPGSAHEAEDAYDSALRAKESLKAKAWAGIAEARLQLDLYAPAIEAAQESLAVSRSGEPAGKALSVICRAKVGDNLPSKSFLLPTVEPLARDADPNSGADTPTPGEERIRRIAGAVSKPRKIYAPPPVYTETARKSRHEGAVIVKAIIEQDGCVTHDAILKGLPYGLSNSALEAVEKFVFAPATLDGKPVRVYYTLTVNFRLQPP